MKRHLVQYGAWMMLACFVAGGVVMPGVHRLHHSYLESQNEVDSKCDHDGHDAAFEEGHAEIVPDHCTLCTAAASYHLMDADAQWGIIEVEYQFGFDHSIPELSPSLTLTIRGPPSAFLV
ncbi:MAG: hypothetical protein HKN43_03735 [Rhodothermales bacterium]|nr:hypothetical protein [Rhodothermales bacterium]